MGGLTSAVHWWEESQMRVLVVGSLVVQFFLLIFTYLRTRAIPGHIRFLMWLAYLGSDAIAIYALATLFNRHKEQDQGGYGGSSRSSTLEVIWAPILLIHLGGNDGITAYNIEDNELWTRHLLTAVSQVTVAIYVFCKSWRGGDKRLLQAAIVMFVPGVLKCFAKPWALKKASIKSLVSSSSCSDSKINEGNQNEDEMDTFEGYVKGAMAFVREQKDEGEGDHRPSQQGDDTSSFQDHRKVKLMERPNEATILGEAYKLFVDLSSAYPLRLSLFGYFWMLSEKRVDKAYGYVRQGLASAFTLLYTKLKVSSGPIMNMGIEGLFTVCLFGPAEEIVPCFIWVSCYILPWAAIGLFHHSHREAYSGIDVKITYALFCCTAVLEMFSQFFIKYVSWSEEQWPEMVAQYNLIGYYARSKNHSNMMWIARNTGCKDFLDQHWCMESCFSSGTIAELVLQYLKDGWKEKIQDPVSYHKFNDNRGQWALENYADELGWSIKRPFDESVLLWHIATDLCFFLMTPRGQSTPSEKAVQCRQMSNYMVYLLFVNPEMLLPGARRYLFTRAYDELNDILGNNHILTENNLNLQSYCCCCLQVVMVENGVMETLINTMRERYRSNRKNFIDQAWDLAQGLLNMGEEMWKVIQGVWVEMLCFSASRCRGYLHAKALGSGGEFLSYVWLLQFYMGMETFTERLERGREVLRSHEWNNVAAQAPRSSDADNGSGTASSSASRIRNRATPSPSHLDTGASPSNDIRITMD